MADASSSKKKAIAAKMEQAASNVVKSTIDYTIHVTETGETVRTVDRICQGKYNRPLAMYRGLTLIFKMLLLQL